MTKKPKLKTVVVAVRLDHDAHQLVKAIVAGLSASDGAGSYTMSSLIRVLVRCYGPRFAQEQGIKLRRKKVA